MASSSSLKMVSSLRISHPSPSPSHSQKQLGCNLFHSFPNQSLKLSTTRQISPSFKVSHYSKISAFFCNKKPKELPQDSPKPSKYSLLTLYVSFPAIFSLLHCFSLMFICLILFLIKSVLSNKSTTGQGSNLLGKKYLVLL